MVVPCLKSGISASALFGGINVPTVATATHVLNDAVPVGGKLNWYTDNLGQSGTIPQKGRKPSPALACKL